MLTHILFAAALAGPAHTGAPLDARSADAAGAPGAPVAPAVLARLADEPSVRVLVALRAVPPGAARREMRRDAVRGDLGESHAFDNADIVTGLVSRDALARLRARPDVLGISLDGTVHPTGQPGPAQIGADTALRLGVDGRGRSIAIVDSGIDALHPDLGGAPAPNAKVVGGWSAGDADDFTDCSGHGTAVAGVAAGPDGVAPGAGVVALKVFGARGGCDSAAFSDVLRGVDWAITNRERLRIDVLNLSLGDDSAHAGFCDDEDPASAAVFSAARRAGIAIVAASGNGSHGDGVAWPACLSDIAAVGMVYSTSLGPTTWGGSAPCTDALSAPDVVPCASNAGPTLALLAPGVRWLTDLPGGGHATTFSGTSAAAPAAAGALLLARQARTMDPGTAVELLRATGAPVVDEKSHGTTPRIDLFAALHAADPASGPCVAEGSALFCTADVSSQPGRVSTVAVALSIERLGDSETRIALAAPDGARVALARITGPRGRVLRVVYGRTEEPLEPLSSLAGHEASGAWRLEIGGSPVRVVSWAIQLETEAPRTATAKAAALILPVAVRSAGRFGAFFTTDLRLYNADTAAPHDATLRFRPAPGAPQRSVTVRIPPSGTRALDDVLGNAFRGAAAGPLEIDALPSIVALARTRTNAPRGGSFDLPVPVFAPDRALGLRDDPAILLPLFDEVGSRVNVGLVEVAGSSAEVELHVRDAQGGSKGIVTLSMDPSGFLQINDVYDAIAQPADAADRIEVRITRGKGKLLAFVTALENGTSNGTLWVPAVAVRSHAVPVVSPGEGARLDLKLSNPSAAPVRVKISYSPAAGRSIAPVLVPIGRGETKLLTDVLGVLFTRTAGDGGALFLSGVDGAAILASARVSWRGEDGVRSFGTAPAASSRGLAPGRRLALPYFSGKTSLAIVETAGVDTRLRLILTSRSGDLLRVLDLTLAAFDTRTWDDLLADLSIDPAVEATAVLDNVYGGALVVQALRFDPITGDAFPITGVGLP